MTDRLGPQRHLCLLSNDDRKLARTGGRERNRQCTNDRGKEVWDISVNVGMGEEWLQVVADQPITTEDRGIRAQSHSRVAGILTLKTIVAK